MTGINSRYLHHVIAATITGQWHLQLTDAPSCFEDVPGIKHQSLICLQLAGHVVRPLRRSRGGWRDVRKMKKILPIDFLSHTNTHTQTWKPRPRLVLERNLYAGCVILAPLPLLLYILPMSFSFCFQQNNGLPASLAHINVTCIVYVYYSNIFVCLGSNYS